ncbi:PAS domain S-box protein [Candidatus Dependentiae bacterium]|nr:PAS domain S-box protein [Candidatus Dependentiae bacterium]
MVRKKQNPESGESLICFAIYRTDTWRIKEFNSGFKKITGFTIKDLRGKKLNQLIPKNSFKKLKANLKSSREFNFEIRVGKNPDYSFYIRKLKIEKIECIILILNISAESLDHAQATKRLIENVVEDSTLWITIISNEFKVLEWNTEAERISGYKKSEVTGNKNYLNFLFPDKKYRKEILENLKDIFQRRTYQPDVVTSIRCKNGQSKKISWFTTPLYDKNGKIAKRILFGRDISERVSIEEELKLSEEKYRTLFDASPFSVMLLDLKRNVLDCNNATLKILGLPKKIILGHKIWELDIEYISDSRKRRFIPKKTDKPNDINPYELCIKNKKKEIIWLEIHEKLLMKGKVAAAIQSVAINITPRKLAEQELLKLSSAVQFSNDSIVITDLNSRIVDVNNAALKLYGTKNKNDLIGKSSFKFFVPSDIAPGKKNTDQTFTVSEVKNIKHNYIRKNGDVILIELDATLIKDTSGKPVGYIGILRDISEREKVFQELHKIEEQFNAISKSTIDMIFIKDKKGKYTYANPAMEKLFGLTASEICKMDDIELFGKEEGLHIQKSDRQVYKENIFSEIRTRLVKGKKITFNVIKVPLRDNKGKTIGLCGISRDVTKEREAEQKLFESELKYKTLYNSSIDAIMILTPEKGFINGNNSTLRLFGCKTEEEFTKKSPWQLSPKYQPDGLLSSKKAKEMIGIALKKGSNFFEWRHKRVDGIEFDATVLLTKMKIGDDIFLQATVRDVTERKLSEIALRESEEKFRMAFESSTDAIFWADPKTGEIIKCNQAAKELVERTSAEILGQNQIFLHPPEKIDFYKEMFMRHIKQGKAIDEEAEVLTKSGKLKFVHITASLINIGGTWINQGIFRDITGKKLAEKALLQSKERYKALSNSINEGIYSIEDGIFTNVNKAMTTIFGYSEEELIGMPSWNLAIPEERDKAKFTMFRKARERDFSPIEVKCLTKDGSNCSVSIRLSAIKNDSVVFGLVSDISEETQAKESLRESESQYFTLVEKANDGIFILQDEEFKFVNHSFKEMIGYHSDEILKLDFKNLFSEHFVLTSDIISSSVIDDFKSSSVYETHLVTKNGEMRDVEISIGLVHFKGRAAIMGIVRDVTEKRKLIKALNRAQKLEAAGKVAGQIAHDFNNLLAPVIAYPEIIKDMIDEGDPIYEFIEIIQKSGKRIVDINEQLLTLGRRGYYKEEVIDLNELIKRILVLQSFPKTVNVKTQFDKHLMMIKGGSSQLIRLLTNLLINAKDAIENIGTISIITSNVEFKSGEKVARIKSPGDYVLLTISDNGIGIPPDIQSKIFEPFFTTKEGRIQGTGLGLSIAYSVVEDHDGYIDFTSELGQGTEFRIYFPVTYEIPKLKPVTENISDLPGGKEAILLVDDDEIQLKVVSDLIIKLGYKVSKVDSGEKALDFLKKQPKDLLILDMRMQGIDGVETFKRIKEINPKQKAIILTGYSLADRIKDAISEGIKQVLKKPTTIRKLAIAIRKELDET